MKIELKSLKVYDRMSEETIAFTAELFINGIKAAFVKNEGCGGCNMIQAYNGGGQKLVAKAEQWAKKQPAVTCDIGKLDGEPFTFPMSLDYYISELVGKQEEEKRLNKVMKTHLIIGLPGAVEYFQVKANPSVTVLLQSEAGRKSLEDMIRQVMASKKIPKGSVVLNANIPDSMKPAPKA